jgi:integrase
MAKMRKRGETWQIDYIDPAGKRVRQAFKKKKEAEAELAKRVALIAENRYLDVKKDCKTIFKELLDRYEENFSHQRSFDSFKKRCLTNFREHFGEQTLISNIRYGDLESYRTQIGQKLTPNGTIRTTATVNREMSCLRHIFSKAIEWELIETNPFKKGRSLIMKENNARLRYLSEDEISRLLAACNPHVKNVVICALNTGMRRGEILGLKWTHIRNGFIYLQKTKTDEPRQIPINEALEALFSSIKKTQSPGTENVFTFSLKKKWKGPEQPEHRPGLKVINFVAENPVQGVKSAFKAALTRAGIVNFRFHDLRHTFASHMIMRGASLKEVQEILGHKTMTMTLRYAHLSQEHKKKAVNLLNGLTSMSQNVTKPAFSGNEQDGKIENAAASN